MKGQSTGVTPRRIRQGLGFLVLAIVACVPHARGEGFEDVINAIARPSLTQKVYFAVIDVTTNAPVEAVAEAVQNGVKRYATQSNLAYKLPPATLPVHAARMRPVSRGQLQGVECNDDVADVLARDTSFQKYGEATTTMVCVFPYEGGYQIDLFANFLQGTGGSNPNVLGAMVGRLITNAIGLGDSSAFIGKTVIAIEQKLADAGMQPKLVELFPAIKGLEVNRDAAPAPRLAAAGTPDTPASTPAPQVKAADQALATGAATSEPQLTAVRYPGALSADGGNFDDAARAIADANQRLAAARARYAAAEASVPSADAGPVRARKELTAMGLTYYSETQFFDAIARGDVVAVRLFLAGQGVDVSHTGPDGRSALQLAQQGGDSNREIAAMLQGAGAR